MNDALSLNSASSVNEGSRKSDALILAEAIRLVSEGVSVTFPVRGCSMLPFIVGGRDSVILEKVSTIKKFDVVLAEVEGGLHVIHRVVKIDGEHVSLMGDGNLAKCEQCVVSQIKAHVNYVVQPGGEKRALDSFGWRLFAIIWFKLLPLRRWLLAFYRKFL